MQSLISSLSKIDFDQEDSIVLAVDVSGSICQDDAAIQRFTTIAELIVNQLKPERLNLIQFDHMAYLRDTFFPGQKITISPLDGGGTNYDNVFELIAKIECQPALVVIITDGYAPWPDEPDMPTLWIMTNDDNVAPWGETIRLEHT